MMKAISALLTLIVTIPIWFFLLYQILDAVHATPAMWAAYWVYLPMNIIAVSLSKLSEK